MVFGIITPSHLSALSLQQALELSNIYLESAYRTPNRDIALVLCHEAEVALYQAKSVNKKYPAHPNDVGYQALREGVATAYIDLGKLLERRGYQSEAHSICKKAEKWGGNAHHPGRLAKSSSSGGIVRLVQGQPHPVEASLDNTSRQNSSVEQHKQHPKVTADPAHVFTESMCSPSFVFKPPEADERLNSTLQLVCCLDLLQSSFSNDETLDPAAQKWLQAIKKDVDEQERLHTTATEIIRAFKRDEIKDAKAVAEVVCLAPVLNKDSFHGLLREFYSGIDHSGLLDLHRLEGLAQLIQGADPGHLNADDLVKILELLSNRLRDTHQQSANYMHQMTLAVSHVLDAMADTRVTGLDREKLHEPLSTYLRELKGSKDPFLVYQAAYAYQALLCVPDNETIWQAAMRRTGKVIQGVSGLVSAVKGLDFIKFIEGLEDIQKGFEGASKVVDLVTTAYDDAGTLFQSGQGFVECLQEGLSFERKREWYSALRGADALILNGDLATFSKLVYEAPCRYDAAFQWGVCQRLGEIAANPMWDAATRRSAIALLGEIYRDDEMWGRQANVKQWILNILMQLAASSKGALQLHATVAEALLQDLEGSGDSKKQNLHRVCRENGPIAYPLKTALPEFASPSLLDRVQNRPDVESNLRMLRKRRTKERGDVVYIQPQAKASLQLADDTQFPLMEKVREFLESEQKVFLLLGDSGAGKSTFSRELEYELWQSYKSKTGRIPLNINLPTIDKPEHDMIAKQLRKLEFTEPQIREMKHHRKFVLICDGYDEAHQTHNLYMSNQLNQPGEWDAQMIISCRSEYLGSDYQDRFQPGDRNNTSDSTLFQEAVITPFTLDQVQTYIKQYVSVHQPLWRVSDYEEALNLIPSLKDLVKNPFLMALSLEVLPRMVDPGQHLSTTRVTRVTLYDHFVEQWLERGKKRLGEKDLSPQAREEFERLSAEGFTLNGIGYLKRLAVAIYKEQDGHPVVEYSQLNDEGTWKVAFFNQRHKQLLLEVSPLTRTGNQHRFIHRSLLEYSLTRAIFDPQEKKNRVAFKPSSRRRGNVVSILGHYSDDSSEDESIDLQQEPDFDSPLVWRNFVDDHSLIQFLKERAQHEPAFKEQLLIYIEHSKRDKRLRKAAANAITILVRAGVKFIGSDLRGIRIRGADLSYGIFDSVQLQGADLRRVDLQGVWLRQADLSKAKMAGARFGEFPSLREDCMVQSCDYSPDGSLLAVSLYNGKIVIYTTSTWEKSLVLDGHTGPVRRAVFSPQGNRMASSSCDKTLRLWDMETGTCQYTLTDHEDEVNCVAYSPQGDQFASASDDKTLKLWNSATGNCYRTLSGHTSGVTSVVYVLKGEQIASGSEDFTVRLWNVETGECDRILTGHSDRVWNIACSPGGDQVASASYDKTIRLWNLETGAYQLLRGHSNFVISIAYSPNGGQVASGGQDGTVRLWDIETGNCLHTLTGHVDVVTDVVYSPKGDQIASNSFDSTVRLWHVSDGAPRLHSSGHISYVNDVKCSPKGDEIATCSMDCTIRLWDIETGTCRRILSGHSFSVSCVAYSPQGDWIISGGYDASVRLWDVKTGISQHTFTGHSDRVNSVAYSPNGNQVASGSDDHTVRLWNVATGDCQRILVAHAASVMSIEFSPDGRWIASGSKDGAGCIWDVGSATYQYVLDGHGFWVSDVAYSPQGDQLATACGNGIVRLWDTSTGDCLSTLTCHSICIRCITYSPEGDLVATGSDDKTVRLWDVASGECRAVISNFQGVVLGIDWVTTLDGSYIVGGCQDGSVLKWQITQEDDRCHVSLKWCLTNGSLNMEGASIQDVRGLTRVNKQLLMQRGAIGEPESYLRETSKKVATMASVISKLKRPLEGKVQKSSAIVTLPAGRPEHQVEQQNEQQDKQQGALTVDP